MGSQELDTTEHTHGPNRFYLLLGLGTRLWPSLGKYRLPLTVEETVDIAPTCKMHSSLGACSVVSNSVIPWTVAHPATISMEFSRQASWSGLLFPPPGKMHSVQFNCSVMSNSLQPHEPQHTRPSCPSPTPGDYLKLMSIESVMPSNPLILCHPLLLLPSIFPSIRVFSNKSVLCIRWPKYWSFSFKDALSSPLNSPKLHPTIKLNSKFQIPDRVYLVQVSQLLRSGSLGGQLL